MSTKQILQVITRSDWGGAQRIVKSLASKIDNVTAVACGPDGELIDRLEDTGVSVHTQPHLRSSPHPADLLAYRDLRDLITTENFDLVHAHSTKAGALARIAASRSHIPSIFSVHGWSFYNTEYQLIRPVIIAGERFLSNRTNEIVCVSENDLLEGRKKTILDQNSGIVIHNGISFPELSTDRNTLRQEFGIATEKPIIGSIGRLAPQKDPLATLRIIKDLRDRGREFAVVMIGSGPLAERCQQFVDTHNLDDVYLPGFRDDALELLPDFDVFLLPSRFEGFPLTVLECLHAGVPVVAHDVGGVAEAIDDEVTGFVVSPDEPNHVFVDRVEQILTSPRRRNEMGRRAQKIANAEFTEDQMVDQYREVYQRVLS